MAYNEAQRAIALEIIYKYGGRVTIEALADIRRVLKAPKLPKRTVYNWLELDAQDGKETITANEKRVQDSEISPLKSPKRFVSIEAKQTARKTLEELFQDIVYAYGEHALTDDAIDGTRGKEAVIAAATALDKLRLIQGLPTEIVAVLPDAIAALRRHGVDPVEWLKATVDELNSADVSTENS